MSRDLNKDPLLRVIKARTNLMVEVLKLATVTAGGEGDPTEWGAVVAAARELTKAEDDWDIVVKEMQKNNLRFFPGIT